MGDSTPDILISGLAYLLTWLHFSSRGQLFYFNFKLKTKMRNKLSLILQLVGIFLFIAGKSNLLPFLVGCLTGLKPDLQGK